VKRPEFQIQNYLLVAALDVNTLNLRGIETIRSFWDDSKVRLAYLGQMKGAWHSRKQASK